MMTATIAVRDSEVALVGAKCQLHDVPDFPPEWIEDENRRDIFKACRDLEKVGAAIDYGMVWTVLQNFGSRVSASMLESYFQDPVSGAYLETHVETIQKSYQRQREHQLRQDIQDAAHRAAWTRLFDLIDELKDVANTDTRVNQLWTPQRIGDIHKPPAENEPVIDGMLRRAEVGSIIAVPKAAKSWMMLQLAFSVIEGKPWLGRDTKEGHVLLVDNELRPNTIQHRACRVARALGSSQAAIDERFSFVPLRGVDFNFLSIEQHLERMLTNQHTLVVFDAKYRFFAGLDENSNGDNTTFHNTVDRWSQKFNVAIELVHHSSKGNQGGKAITDVGAGGGAQSRAADCHTVLREHEEDGLFVLESELRTFKKPEPQSVRFEFPLWQVEDVDAVVKQQQTRSDTQNDKKIKERTSAILQMLRKSPSKTHSENKLSNNHPAAVAFQAAIQELQNTGEIEWIDDFKEPRAQEVTGGWKLSGRSEQSDSPHTDTLPPAL